LRHPYFDGLRDDEGAGLQTISQNIPNQPTQISKPKLVVASVERIKESPKKAEIFTEQLDRFDRLDRPTDKFSSFEASKTHYNRLQIRCKE
jgi:hypothetical protein